MSELLELVTLQAFGGLKNEINERLSNIEYNLLNSVEYSFDTYEIYTVPIQIIYYILPKTWRGYSKLLEIVGDVR